MADIQLEGHVRGIPAGTTEVLGYGYVPVRLLNGGPGICVIEGDVIRPGQSWVAKYAGQTKIVVSTLDLPAKVGT